jgi:hypothetical protein
MDVFDEMVAREEFIGMVANGISAVNAGVAVGWTPAHTRKLMRNEEFAEIVKGAQEQANGTVEEALYHRAVAGNVAAMQMWLFNREPDRWRDVRRIEVRSDTRISVVAVESVKAGVLELLRDQGASAMQALESGEIIDADVIDDGDES